MDGDDYICDYYSVDYSSNMNTDVVISIIIINNVDYYDISSASAVRHQNDSHEKLWRGRVIARGASLTEPVRASKFLALQFVCVSLAGQPVDFLFELLHLIHELILLVLQNVLLLHPLETTRLSVAPVLEGPPFLLQTDDLVLAEAPQVSVELTHRHGHQLVVGETVLHV